MEGPEGRTRIEFAQTRASSWARRVFAKGNKERNRKEGDQPNRASREKSLKRSLISSDSTRLFTFATIALFHNLRKSFVGITLPTCRCIHPDFGRTWTLPNMKTWLAAAAWSGQGTKPWISCVNISNAACSGTVMLVVIATEQNVNVLSKNLLTSLAATLLRSRKKSLILSVNIRVRCTKYKTAKKMQMALKICTFRSGLLSNQCSSCNSALDDTGERRYVI